MHSVGSICSVMAIDSQGSTSVICALAIGSQGPTSSGVTLGGPLPTTPEGGPLPFSVVWRWSTPEGGPLPFSVVWRWSTPEGGPLPLGGLFVVAPRPPVWDSQ